MRRPNVNGVVGVVAGIVVGVVSAVTWRAENVVNYEVSWVNDGDAKGTIIEGWRLSRATA